NMTGTTIITTELATKRLNLLYDLDPGVRNVGFLMNQESPSADAEIEEVVVAARNTRRPSVVLKASSVDEIDAAFASAAERQVRALMISADPLFMTRRAQLVDLAARHRMPVVYPFREFVDDGGLMSYGAEPRIGLSPRRCVCGSHPQGR